jgi:hypothetical protein
MRLDDASMPAAYLQLCNNDIFVLVIKRIS